MPVELRQIVETRQRDAEAGAQTAPDLGLDLRRARQHAQPQLQGCVIAAAQSRLVAEFVGLAQQCARRVVAAHAVSPPQTAIAWPVIAEAPSPQSQRTASATSAGRTIRPCGLPATSCAIASSRLRPVFATMLSTLSCSSAVSV